MLDTLTPNQKKFCHAVIAIFLLFIGLTGLWCVDIGTGGMVLNAEYGLDIQVGNGWFARSPIQQYHIGLWLLGISVLLMCILLVYNIIIYDHQPKS